MPIVWSIHIRHVDPGRFVRLLSFLQSNIVSRSFEKVMFFFQMRADCAS